jgi:hypothetical protein
MEIFIILNRNSEGKTLAKGKDIVYVILIEWVAGVKFNQPLGGDTPDLVTSNRADTLQRLEGVRQTKKQAA